MKHLLLVLLCFSLFSCGNFSNVQLTEKDGKHMGILPKQNGRIHYTSRVAKSGMNRSQLRHLVRQWLALDHSPISPREIVSDSLFRDDVIVSCSFTPPRLETNNGFKIPTPSLTYTIVIDNIDGGYRTEVSNFQVSTTTLLGRKGAVITSDRLEYYNVGPRGNLIAYLTRVNEEIARQLSSLESYVDKYSK